MDGLKPAHLGNIRKGYVELQELEQAIERAKACNFDCADADQRCQEMKIQCQRIITTYGGFFHQEKG
jgi:hypothetical protein